MRSSRIEREGAYSPMPQWLIEQASRTECVICNRRYGDIDGEFVLSKQAIDHIFPVRFLLHLAMDPHLPVNVLSVCNICHGRKLRHETLIFAGDVIGFIGGLRRIGYPLERLVGAAGFYGFKEVVACCYSSLRKGGVKTGRD